MIAGNRKNRRLQGYVAVVMVCLVAAVASAVTKYGDISIRPGDDFQTSGNNTHGYCEYRFLVTNHSAARSHNVTLVLPAQSWSYRSGSDCRVRRTVAIGPKSSSVVSLSLPPLKLSGNGAKVIVDGTSYDIQDGSLDFSCCDTSGSGYGASYSGSSSSFPLNILVEHDLLNLVQASSGGQSISYKPKKFDAPGWSTNWLGYTSYDGVVVSAKKFRLMSSATRRAIIQYVECGGSLLIAGKTDKLPEAWGKATRLKRGLKAYYAGFGRCLVSDERNMARFPKSYLTPIVISWSNTANPFIKNRTIEAANNSFPVVEDLTVPVRGMFFLMIVFAVLIGPLNLIILKKIRKRIWLLWTVPLVSVITCLCVFGYALVSEGISGHRRTETLTILDERTHRATSIGWTAFYCPLSPGDGLHFDYDTELSLQEGRKYDDYSSYGWDRGRSKARRTINWTNDQHLASGWISARVPAHFRIRRSQTRRERLTLSTNDDGNMEVVNGLGACITKLYLCDAKGRLYKAGGEIAPGARSGLDDIGKHKKIPAPDVLRKAYREGWTEYTQKLSSHPRKYLRRGTYIAVLDSTPFVEAGVEHAEPHKCRTVVYGIMAK